jgi:hypothetical protein
MFAEQGSVGQGALAGYGVNYYEGGRLAATYVQRVLTGTSPQNLPVESLSRVELALTSRRREPLESRYRRRCCYARTGDRMTIAAVTLHARSV